MVKWKKIANTYSWQEPISPFKLIHVYHIYLNEKYCYHTIHILFITFVKYVTYSYLFITACLTYSKLHMSYT